MYLLYKLLMSTGDGGGQTGWKVEPRLFTAQGGGLQGGAKPLGFGCSKLSDFLIKILMLMQYL